MATCVWDELVGQTRATGFLRRAAAAGAVAHAYLFVGPTGTGKKTAARALACAVFCEDDGCGSCHVCSRVRASVHPDVHYVRPEGAAGDILIDQIRELIRDVHLKPIEAPYKVYVIEDAERLRVEAANAFLKTLEEPPADTVVVLLATDFESVLPTVASRCHVVRFAPVASPTAVALVVERTGAAPEEALAALAASDGVIPRAIEFLRSPERRNARLATLGLLKRLVLMDGHDVLDAARQLLTSAHAPIDELKEDQSNEIAEAREYLARSAVSKLEARHKRQLKAREREGVIEILGVTESWLRDCLVLAKGLPELIENADVADATSEVAAVLSVPAALRALDAVSVARSRIAYNVSPQLAVEAMLFDIQEVLKCPR